MGAVLIVETVVRRRAFTADLCIVRGNDGFAPRGKMRQLLKLTIKVNAQRFDLFLTCRRLFVNRIGEGSEPPAKLIHQCPQCRLERFGFRPRAFQQCGNAEVDLVAQSLGESIRFCLIPLRKLLEPTVKLIVEGFVLRLELGTARLA